MTETYEYVNAPTGMVHLVRQRDVATSRFVTLCNRNATDWVFGDETQSTVAATCGTCKKVWQANTRQDAINPTPGWPEGTDPFDEPHRANKLIHARDRNRLLKMADSLEKLDPWSERYDPDRALDIENGINFDAIVQELRRIGNDNVFGQEES